jgi:hypothetical protein
MKAPTLVNLTPLSLLPLAASQGGAVPPRDVDSRLFGS